MFLKANKKNPVKIDRCFNKPHFPSFDIFISESLLFLFTPQNNYLISAFHRVCAFMGLISKIYFVKLYVHFILCACFECSVAQYNFSCMYFHGKVYFFSYYIFFMEVCQVAS